jgi:pimeloyl-ACP methyl ester carboxylesterase
MWGDRDLFFRPEQGQRTADAIPGAELVTLPGCGHLVPKERPEEVAMTLRKLQTVAP